jgi:DNA transformation protein
MPINQDLANYIEDQLSAFGPFESKRMFGGIGYFREGKMFGLLGKDVFHLKAEDHNRPDYEAAGMKAFMSSEKKQGMPYYEVPADVLEDKDQLKVWAEKAYEAAVRAKK